MQQGTARGRISRGGIQLTCLAGRGGPGQDRLSYFQLTRSADVAQGQKE
jgi:hypothetical protein